MKKAQLLKSSEELMTNIDAVIDSCKYLANTHIDPSTKLGAKAILEYAQQLKAELNKFLDVNKIRVN